MKPVLVAVIAAVAAVWIAACATSTRADQAPAATAASLEFRGEVVRLEFEGGFWGIVAEDGRRYDPGRLPAEFQQPGLKVRITARPARGRVSFRMWGAPVDLVHIERAEAAR